MTTVIFSGLAMIALAVFLAALIVLPLITIVEWVWRSRQRRRALRRLS